MRFRKYTSYVCPVVIDWLTKISPEIVNPIRSDFLKLLAEIVTRQNEEDILVEKYDEKAVDFSLLIVEEIRVRGLMREEAIVEIGGLLADYAQVTFYEPSPGTLMCCYDIANPDALRGNIRIFTNPNLSTLH